jgi:hypothetical protein
MAYFVEPPDEGGEDATPRKKKGAIDVLAYKFSRICPYCALFFCSRM